MDFTPEDMQAVQTCLEGIDRNVPVTVEPAAAKLLMPNTVRTVADILALAECLRLAVERWQPAAEVRIERVRSRPPGRCTPSHRAVTLPSGCLENFWVGR
jgi:hypothetical protein